MLRGRQGAAPGAAAEPSPTPLHTPPGGIDTEDDYGYWGYGLICQKRKEADR